MSLKIDSLIDRPPSTERRARRLALIPVLPPCSWLMRTTVEIPSRRRKYVEEEKVRKFLLLTAPGPNCFRFLLSDRRSILAIGDLPVLRPGFLASPERERDLGPRSSRLNA
jgi:hypothetical protein